MYDLLAIGNTQFLVKDYCLYPLTTDTSINCHFVCFIGYNDVTHSEVFLTEKLCYSEEMY